MDDYEQKEENSLRRSSNKNGGYTNNMHSVYVCVLHTLGSYYYYYYFGDGMLTEKVKHTSGGEEILVF